MTKTVKAKFTQGIFQPLEHFHLPEGKEVIVTIIESEQLQKSNWESIYKIFKEANTLNLSQKSHEEILSNLREFKETQ